MASGAPGTGGGAELNRIRLGGESPYFLSIRNLEKRRKSEHNVLLGLKLRPLAAEECRPRRGDPQTVYRRGPLNSPLAASQGKLKPQLEGEHYGGALRAAASRQAKAPHRKALVMAGPFEPPRQAGTTAGRVNPSNPPQATSQGKKPCCD